MADREQVQEILRQLEPHAPSWVATLREYIAGLEAACIKQEQDYDAEIRG